jgi:hypothetical protein
MHWVYTASRLFHLSVEKVEYLFHPVDDDEAEERDRPGDSASAHEVAEHIRKFISRDGEVFDSEAIPEEETV